MVSRERFLVLCPPCKDTDKKVAVSKMEKGPPQNVAVLCSLPGLAVFQSCYLQSIITQGLQNPSFSGRAVRAVGGLQKSPGK